MRTVSLRFYVLSPHEHGGLWLPNVNFLNLKLQSPVRDGTTNERYAVLDDEDMRSCLKT